MSRLSYMVNIVPGGRGSCCKGERRQPRRRYVYCADPGNPQAGTREASRTTRSRQAADRTSSTKAAPLHSPHSTLSSFYTRASHGRAHLWHLRCRHRAYGHWTLYVWGVKSWDGKDQGLTRVADMLFNGEGEAFNVRLPR
jgi:hypothetical protein